MHDISPLLKFSSHTLQEIALVFMAIVYTIRVIWFLKHKAGGERQPTTATLDSAKTRGILYSWANVVMPWAMESTRRKFFMYIQFVVFHLGVTAAIALSFIIPYGPGLLTPSVVIFLQVVIGAAFVVGIMRFIRRAGSVYMRAISSPDDYFSLALLTAWFFFAVLAAPNQTANGEWHLITYFILTAFFLIYVPFSKISHYLYYPFTRYYFGKSMGYRGVYPIQRG